jgi:hypothetical protein
MAGHSLSWLPTERLPLTNVCFRLSSPCATPNSDNSIIACVPGLDREVGSEPAINEMIQQGQHGNHRIARGIETIGAVSISPIRPSVVR